MEKQRINYVIADNEYRFDFLRQDTICYTGGNKFMIRGMPFRKQTIFSPKNLRRKRMKILRDDMVFKFGRETFIEIYGEGKSMKKAFDNFNRKDCPHR